MGSDSGCGISPRPCIASRPCFWRVSATHGRRADADARGILRRTMAEKVYSLPCIIDDRSPSAQSRIGVFSQRGWTVRTTIDGL